MGREILALTGTRTKIVWAHQVTGESKRWGSSSAEFELRGFDTNDGKSRVILKGPAGYGNPSIMPDGQTVIFSDTRKTIYAVDWDGKNKRKLGTGFSLCGWRHPETGVQWVYLSRGEFSPPIHRLRLDQPEKMELVWDKPCGPTSGFQVSADGTRLACLYKYPQTGLINLTTGKHAAYGGGCEAGMAPDNSYRFFHMGESVGHSGVMMYDRDGANKRALHFGKLPDSPGHDAWNPRWSTDARFLTVSSPNAGKGQDVYLGKFNAGFTAISGWVRVSRLPGQDLGSHAWVQSGLGQWTGEAPLSVSIPAPGAGNWLWDFGDGGKSQGTGAQHRYLKPGRYTVTARQGNVVHSGRVDVATELKLLARARLQDETRLLVHFNQPVALSDAGAKLKSGVKVTGIEPGITDNDIVLRLGGKLPAVDSLKITGVSARAARGKTIDKPIAVKRPAWPLDRSELLAIWERRERFHYDATSKQFVTTRPSPLGLARVNRIGTIVLRGGVFDAAGAGTAVANQCRRRNALSIEAVITPDSIKQGTTKQPRHIISCSAGPGDDKLNFSLSQAGAKLFLHLRTRPPGGAASTVIGVTELCTLKNRTAHHVVVTYEPGQVRCYLDGKLVKRSDELRGALDWPEVPTDGGFTMGGETTTTQPWWGKLERLALFARTMTPREAAAHARIWSTLARRRPRIGHSVVRAKLIARSTAPKPSDIAPYIDALVVNEYEVIRVLDGAKVPTKLLVMQWGLINKRTTPVVRLKPGSLHTLEIEHSDDHPELDSEAAPNSTLAGSAQLDLERYLDVTVRLKTAK